MLNLRKSKSLAPVSITDAVSADGRGHICADSEFAAFVLENWPRKANCREWRKRAGKTMLKKAVYTSDTIGDFLIRIKNGYLARHKTVETPYGKVLLEIGKILKIKGFIEDIKVQTAKEKKTIVITLAYPRRKAALTDLKRVSKPGLRIYVRKSRIPRVFGGFGTVILSTPQGIMTGGQAAKKNVGGEVLCKIW